MSDDVTKQKRSKRFLKDENAVKRQVKIAKEHGASVEVPHKYEKMHSMNCGNPGCSMCSNPRHNGFNNGKARLTQQERRMFQDTDDIRSRHTNGTTIKN